MNIKLVKPEKTTEKIGNETALVSANFLFKTQNTVISAATIIAIATGLSAVLGLFKGRLLTYFFGVSNQLAIFYTADRIPNMVYSVVVVGALSTIFIPVFSSQMHKDKNVAWHTASTMLNATLAFFFVIGVIAFAFSPWIMGVLAVGKFTPAEIGVGANLMRIMLVSQLVLILSSFLSTLLQSFKYFLIPAIAPLVYNLGMIVGTVLFAKQLGIYAPAIGVFIGALLHLIIQLPLIKRIKFKYSFSFDIRDKGIREIFSMMPYRILSVLITNTISTLNNSMAILISTSSVVVLKFATQLQTFPVNLFGTSIAMAVLPTLSAESVDTDKSKFKKTFVTSILQMLFLVMPASIILIVLKIPVVRLIYGVSNFPWEATVQTANALAFFSISIFSQSSIYIVTRAFYALKDTSTPVKSTVVTIFLNILLSLLFVKVLGLGVWSLALSYSITSYFDLGIMMTFLWKKLGGFNMNEILIPVTKIGFASLIMGICLYTPLKLLDNYVFDTTRTLDLIFLTGITGFAGIVVYLLLTRWFKVEEIELFYKVLQKLNIMEKPATLSEAEKVETNL